MATKSKIINPVAEGEIKAALSTAHGMFVVDKILNIKVGAFESTVTLGFENPAGRIMPALTIKMPAPLALQISEEIMNAAKENKAIIKSEQDEFLKSIK